jgi:hypothetical protein
MADHKKHFIKGIDLLRKDNWDGALDNLELAAKFEKHLDSLDPVHLLIALGVAYIGAGNFKAARKVLTTAAKLPPSPYLPDTNKFIEKLTAILDAETESSPPVPGGVIPKGESVIMTNGKPVITARGNPVTMERTIEKNVITTAALRQIPTSEDMHERIAGDVFNAIFRQYKSEKPKIEISYINC